MGIKHAIRGAAAFALFTLLTSGCTVTTAPAANASDGGAATGNGNGAAGAAPAGDASTSEAADNDDFTTAQPVTAGSTINARWEKPGDKDYYAITIPAGQDGYLQVTVSETAANVNPSVTVYRSDRALVTAAQAP